MRFWTAAYSIARLQGGRTSTCNSPPFVVFLFLKIFLAIIIFVTRHAKRYELGGRRHFEKIRLKVNVASLVCLFGS